MKKKILYLAVALSLSAGLVHAAENETEAAPVKKSSVPNGWAYKPVLRVAAPEVKQKAWERTTIDAFILAKLEEKGIKPSPEANRATYIRRATLDAWGLLPTPEEVTEFEKDRSTNAYEKLVDRLLESPHYGERQARRWLDLARYADSDGFQNDQTRPNNWRYRDYVIDSFNKDKPFDQFIREQLAGDELWPDSQDAKIATGFLAGYPDNYNSRDLVQRKYQIETDITDLVGEALLGSTVGCARCHNHKIDTKLTQKEYFQLQAFFANVVVNEKTPLAKGSERPEDLEYAKQQAAYQEATKDIRAQQKAILDPVREKGRKYYSERYLTDSRDSIFKPEKDWTPLDRWVNFRKNAVASERDIVSYLRLSSENKESPIYDPANLERYEQYEKLTEHLKKFDKLRPTRGSTNYTTVSELGPIAPPTHVRFTGVHEKPLEAVEPGLPVLWAGDTKLTITPTANSTGRRTALANWIASPENPLTARVYVNRVWSQHFVTGIASNTGDFGRAGPKPTHPELLDYLADNFVKEGWSSKKLQREILLSSVYRQSSAEREDVLKSDPDNSLLAVYPRKRLDAEEIRDALLYASGKLDATIGGPAVFPAVPSNLVAGNQLNGGNGGGLWENAKDASEQNRRSIYTFIRRSLPYPLTASFDPADPSHPHHKRDVTTTPLQALTLFNSDIVVGWSQALAGRIIREAGDNENDQLDHLYTILFSRKPDSAERSALKAFWKSEAKTIQEKAWTDKFAVAVPTGLTDTKELDPFKAAAFVDLVHAVANSNDFAYRF